MQNRSLHFIFSPQTQIGYLSIYLEVQLGTKRKLENLSKRMQTPCTQTDVGLEPKTWRCKATVLITKPPYHLNNKYQRKYTSLYVMD